MSKSTIVIIAVLFMCGSAHAGHVLKQVQVPGLNRVELQFDGPIRENQIKTEFIRDIVQVNLNNVVVYPAKILTSNQGNLTKVFAYQYTPKQVRCRLSVKGTAESYKNRVKIKVQGKTVVVQILDSKGSPDQITMSAAAPKVEISGEGQSMLDKILNKPEAVSATAAASETVSKKESKEPIKMAKPLPSPLKSFAWLGVLLLGFFGMALILRKIKSKGMSASLTKWTGMKFGKQAQVIEMVANQYLGPKKSISVVRVRGRLLVLGVSEESISLITELQSEDEIDSMLDQEETKSAPRFVTAAPLKPTAPVSSPSAGSFRDEIRRKMEGMKSL